VTLFDVAILAGGQGTRLKPRAGAAPKPMVPVLGRPALAYQLALCRSHGFSRILLLVHYEQAVIRAWAGDGSAHGVTIGYQVEETPRGTAGALRDALSRLQETFLVLYGDTYVDVDLRRMWDVHRRQGADATAFVHPNDHPDDSDLVELDRNGFITAIHAYPHADEHDLPNLVNAGLYVVQRNACGAVIPSHGQADLVKHTFPALLRERRRLFGYRSPEYIKDFGTPDRLDQVEQDVRVGMPEMLSGRRLRPAVFLDRDGTLNTEVHYLNRPEQVQLLDGVAGAMRQLNRAGHLAASSQKRALPRFTAG
jgi:NDP-sugar pyrophosphorylase family protein